MLHIVEKNLRRYFCFLFCFIFIFGVNFGFVNLPRVSAEGQNEVVKWGADVGDPLEISNVTSTSVEGKVSPSVSMKSVNAYVYPYPSATEEELVSAMNNTTIAATNVVNKVAANIGKTNAQWNIDASNAASSAANATTIDAASSAANAAVNAVNSALTNVTGTNVDILGIALWTSKTAYLVPINDPGPDRSNTVSHSACLVAYEIVNLINSQYTSNDPLRTIYQKFCSAGRNNDIAGELYYLFKYHDTAYSIINSFGNSLYKDCFNTAFNTAKVSCNYYGLPLPPSALAASNKSLGDISSGEQTFEVNNLEPNKRYILAIDFEDDSGNPGYITRSFTTPTLVNLQINGLIGYYTGQPQELVDQFKFFDNGVEITDEGILGILKLNVYLRAQKRGGNSTNWYNLNNLSNLTGISSGIYDFYYYVDSEAEGMSAYIVSA